MGQIFSEKEFPKRFCKHCGLEMIQDNMKIKGYDQDTGKPCCTLEYRCPKYSGVFSGHEKYTLLNYYDPYMGLW